MGLTSWKGRIVRKGDIIIAKNYLKSEEIDELNRLVVIFLDSAELRVKRRKDLTLKYWEKNIDQLIEFQDKDILSGPGKISNSIMKSAVHKVYDEFDTKRKSLDALEADRVDDADLKELSDEIGNK